MRLSLAAIALSLAFIVADGGRAQYIHAPEPPYCGPRGGGICSPREGPGVRETSEFHSESLSAYAEEDLAELSSLRVFHKVDELDAKYAFLGRVKLRLLGPDGGLAELADVRLESEVPLTPIRARYLRWRIRSKLAVGDVREIWIERFSDDSPESEPAEYCEFMRNDFKWELECDVE